MLASPSRPPFPSSSDREADGRRTAGYIVGGSAIALLVASLVTGAIFLRQKDAFEEKNDKETPMSEKEEAHASASTMQIVSTVLLGTAVAGGAVSTYFLLSEPAHARDAAVGNSRPRGLAVQAGIQGRF
jgi:NADH:ubiquinone oxidoreductase subunit 5 (subunit L)/multisubunit Na+/H+ antiporter MnhA subunit